MFFGVFFVVPTSGDAYRQYQEFRDFSFIDFPYMIVNNNDPGLNEDILRATFDNLIN